MPSFIHSLKTLFTLSLLFVLSGCTTASFNKSGYVHEKLPFWVKFSNPDKQQFLSDNWKLENFYKEDGVFNLKKGSEWEVEYSFDLDGDGEQDKKETAFTYDILLENLENDGVIMLRAIPLSTKQRRKKLEVLMDSIVENLSYVSFSDLQFTSSSASVGKKTYIAKKISSKKTTVDGVAALEADIEVASVERLNLDSSSRSKRIRSVIFRPNFDWHVSSWKKESNGQFKKFPFPVLMIAVYRNQPKMFKTELPAFNDFLKLIQLKPYQDQVANSTAN